MADRLEVPTNIYSSLPVLRQLGASKEGREIFKNEDSLNMMKVWLALEVRQLIHASIQDVRILKNEEKNNTNKFRSTFLSRLTWLVLMSNEYTEETAFSSVEFSVLSVLSVELSVFCFKLLLQAGVETTFYLSHR